MAFVRYLHLHFREYSDQLSEEDIISPDNLLSGCKLHSSNGVVKQELICHLLTDTRFSLFCNGNCNRNRWRYCCLNLY
ncbi:unnamed protein product [Protopolystoma xenopodis]|uniref:Uncharacterized protein n=1 Tax=Protopolystoma xenopodis TaxID=117903 RepID=A0A3S5CVV2_9PLAT|nr:unnamed protein product [Protopolystoma xenopodis]